MTGPYNLKSLNTESIHSITAKYKYKWIIFLNKETQSLSMSKKYNAIQLMNKKKY